MSIKISNFREVTQAFIVTVLEGEGTIKSPSRLVHYVFTRDGAPVGVIDPYTANHNTP